MEPPYYAVIFTSKRTDIEAGYNAMNDKLFKLIEDMPGFLGVESARADIGVTVSYWETLDDVLAWKNDKTHQIAQKLGKEKWYEWYKVRVCKVEREYEFGED